MIGLAITIERQGKWNRNNVPLTKKNLCNYFYNEKCSQTRVTMILLFNGKVDTLWDPPVFALLVLLDKVEIKAG